MCRNIDTRYSSDDPAVRARARGRAITAALARLVERNRRGEFWIDFESVLAGGPVLYGGGESVRERTGTPLPPDGHWGDPSKALRHVWDAYTPHFGVDYGVPAGTDVTSLRKGTPA